MADRDYAKEAYETFIVSAKDADPTDPVAAIEAYFAKAASDDLKARAAAEGKTAETCWAFIEAVVRHVGGNCHIDPVCVYAIAMHYFEDVPADWNSHTKPAKAEKTPKAKPAKAKKTPKAPEQTFFFEVLEGGGNESE